MRVLLLYDSTTYPNWGGRAATISLRLMIREVGGEIIKSVMIDDLERSSLDGHLTGDSSGRRSPKEMARLLLPPVVPKLIHKLAPDFGRTSEHLPIPRAWAEYQVCADRVLSHEAPWPELVRSFAEMDVAIVFGDGDMYGNGVLPRTLLFLSYLIKQRFSKPVIMVNHSADFDHPDLRAAAEKVYPLFDDVVFRDPLSAERCGALCAGRFAADTAFWFMPAPRTDWTAVAQRPTYFDIWPDTAAFDPAQPYICIGGSSIIDTTRDKDAVERAYASLITHIQSLYSGQIVLTVSDGVDYPILGPIAKRLRLPLIGVTTPVQQAVDILGNADAYVGGRWHPSIFALRGGTPVLALSSKTFKMRALTDMSGLPQGFDALHLEESREAIGLQLTSYLEEGSSLRDRLLSWADGMARSSWENVAFLGSRS